MVNVLVKGHFDTVTYGGKTFPTKFLQSSLQDVKTAVFFAQLYKLSPQETADLVVTVMPSDVSKALFAEAETHSMELQDYLVEEYWDDISGEWQYDVAAAEEGSVERPEPVHAEILPEVWKGMEIEIADSIAEVAEKIGDVIVHMPGKTGEMVFKNLAVVNSKRPVIGDFKARIQHPQVKKVLLVLDVSGSMTADTVRTILGEVVGLAYETNASFAVVSNTCTFWGPGEYNERNVLEAAEFMGTHYEQLAPLFDDQVWDAVITVADYDSSPSAKVVLQRCQGRIGQLFDISLVSRSTYLAECLSHMADEVRPLLIASESANLVW